MLFVMFYNSNLRQMIIAPSVDPEINSDEDILKYGVEAIHSETPNEYIPIFYNNLNAIQPERYAKASEKQNFKV